MDREWLKTGKIETAKDLLEQFDEDVVSFADYKAKKNGEKVDDGLTHVHINSVIITGCEGPNDDNRFPFGKEISLEEAQALINKEDYICYINDNCDKCYFQPKFTVNGEEKAVSDYLKYSSELRVDLHDGAKYGYEQISIIEHLKSILEHSGGLENVEIDNKEIPYDKAALEKEYGTREETLKKYVDSHKIELPKGRGCADKTIEQIAVGDIFYDSDYSDYSRSYYYDFYRVTKKTSKSIWLEPLKRQRVEEPVIKDDRKDYQGYQYPSDEVDAERKERGFHFIDFSKPFRLTTKYDNKVKAEQGAGHYKNTVYPWSGTALAEEFKMEKSIYSKLNEELSQFLEEDTEAPKASNAIAKKLEEPTVVTRCNNCMTYLDPDVKACPKCKTDAYLMDLSDEDLKHQGIDKNSIKIEESADKTEELKKIFADAFKDGKMNCFETAKGIVYVEPQGEQLVYGGMTNAGIIPEYKFDYDFDQSFDWNLQGHIEQIMEEEGYPIDEAVEKYLSYKDGSDGGDEAIYLFEGDKLLNWKKVDLDCPTDEFIIEEAKKYFDIPDKIEVKRPLEINLKEEKLFKPELTPLPKKDAKFNIGDKVTVKGEKGEIIKVKPMKMSDTCVYDIKLENGKIIDRYEEEINESLNEAKEYPKMLSELIKKCWYGNGKFARYGKWSIGLGGYDHGYEVYYDGDTVVQIKPDNEVYFGRDERTVKEICGYDYQQILKAIQEVEPNAFIPEDEYKLIIEYDEEYFNDLWNVIEKYIEDDKVANTESGNGYYYVYSNDEDFLYDISAEIKENDTENRFNTRIIEV